MNKKITFAEFIRYQDMLGSGSSFPRVNTRADLPTDATLYTGQTWLVLTTTGVIGFRDVAGLWYSNGVIWDRLSVSFKADQIYYDNTISSLSADNSKSALDELNFTKVPKTAEVIAFEATNGIIPEAGSTYTDSDAVGANPSAKIYPNGTVIGSTDNGKYTRYADGRIDLYSMFAIWSAAGSSTSTSVIKALPYPIIIPVTSYKNDVHYRLYDENGGSAEGIGQINRNGIHRVIVTTTSIGFYMYTYVTAFEETAIAITYTGRWK